MWTRVPTQLNDSLSGCTGPRAAAPRHAHAILALSEPCAGVIRARRSVRPDASADLVPAAESDARGSQRFVDGGTTMPFDLGVRLDPGVRLNPDPPMYQRCTTPSVNSGEHRGTAGS